MTLGSDVFANCLKNDQHSTCNSTKKIQGGKKSVEPVESNKQLEPGYVTMPMLPNRPKDLPIEIKVDIL